MIFMIFSSALEIKEYMNPKIKPCDNFYDYVCGNFMKDVPKKEMPPQNNHIYMVIKKVDEMLRNSVEHDITDKDPESFKKMKGLYDLCLKDDGECLKLMIHFHLPFV